MIISRIGSIFLLSLKLNMLLLNSQPDQAEDQSIGSKLNCIAQNQTTISKAHVHFITTDINITHQLDVIISFMKDFRGLMKASYKNNILHLPIKYSGTVCMTSYKPPDRLRNPSRPYLLSLTLLKAQQSSLYYFDGLTYSPGKKDFIDGYLNVNCNYLIRK